MKLGENSSSKLDRTERALETQPLSLNVLASSSTQAPKANFEVTYSRILKVVYTTLTASSKQIKTANLQGICPQTVGVNCSLCLGGGSGVKP